ncbi:bifunctional diguanylate cyclase/phosphodiesterase [Virgibacillus sp. W0430]|uniref:bifunctional diguanylate cyclase/phosphodiesterase n=1 Tax=Virgibacillus sp. W0430 TaxID=3391580 RepID=UPI003F44B474
MKKRHLLIYVLLGLVFIGTVYFAIVNYKSTKNFVLQSVERETDELLNGFVAEVERFSLERTLDIKLLANHIPYMIEKDEDITQFLSIQTESIPYFVGLSFITPEGIIKSLDGDHFKVQQRDYFEKALNGELVFSDVFSLNEDASQQVTAIFAPVENGNGETIGVLSGVVNLSDIVSELVEASNLPGTVFLLKDKDVLFNSNEASFEGTIPHSEQLLKRMDTQQAGSWADTENDFRFIKYKTTFNDWVVVVDSSSNDATDEIFWSLSFNLLLVIGALLIIFVVFFYLIRVQRREKLQAEQDLLTGLGNRVRLESNIEKKKDQAPEASVTFYLIKLDRFLEVTERLGYDVSDQLLYEVSNRLRGIQKKINVYRVGDEEFVITTEDESFHKQCEMAAEIVRKMEEPIPIGRSTLLNITASVGVRTAEIKEGKNIIMQDVLFACHEAIKCGGNQFVYFTEQLADKSEQQRQLTNNLANALENEEFYLVYQPIYSISENRIVSFEALMRWKSPVLGEIRPAQFIPLLEENEKIVDAGRWLMKEVAKQVVRWEQAGYHDFSVTLNVSTKQLKYDGFLADVQQIIKETGVTPTKLVFEVTESIVVHDTSSAINILERLNELGIKTAIDDFGTGYSSLSLLKTLPFQYMKLDRAFVMEVVSDEGKSEAILRGLIEIANSLKLTTISEGIETFEQFEILEKLGAHRIQGYYFSKPVMPEKAVEFLNCTTFSR